MVALAIPASAHAALVSTTPAQGTQFPAGQPPKTVAALFDDNVTATSRSLAVYDGHGRSVTVVPQQTRNHKEVAANLPSLADGTYVVVWHIVSDDGHPEQGAFSFTVGNAGVSTVDIAGLVAGRSSGTGISVSFGLDRLLGYLAVLLLVGGLVFVLWAWPEGENRTNVRRLLLVSAGVAVVVTLASIPLEAAYANGGGPSTLFDRSALRSVLDARFGLAALVRTALVVVLLACMVPLSGGRSRGSARVVVALSGIALFGTYAYAGHGDTGHWPAIGFVTDVTHMGAAALWLGGLVVLLVAQREHTAPASLTEGAERFSRIALPAIAVVVLSGLVQGWRQIGSWDALWHTSYSRLLLLKVLVVLAIVIAASAARTTLRERTTRRAFPGATTTPGPGEAAGERVVATEVRSSVLFEAALGIAVVALTAALVVTPPAREVEAAAQVPTPRTVHLAAAGRDVRYGVVVQPALAGYNIIVVSPRLLHGSGFLPTTLTADAHRPGAHGSTTIAFSQLTDGRWIAVSNLPRAGIWRISLTGSTPPTSETARVRLTLR